MMHFVRTLVCHIEIEMYVITGEVATRAMEDSCYCMAMESCAWLSLQEEYFASVFIGYWKFGAVCSTCHITLYNYPS
jgi:hypothetical protein